MVYGHQDCLPIQEGSRFVEKMTWQQTNAHHEILWRCHFQNIGNGGKGCTWQAMWKELVFFSLPFFFSSGHFPLSSSDIGAVDHGPWLQKGHKSPNHEASVTSSPFTVTLFLRTGSELCASEICYILKMTRRTWIWTAPLYLKSDQFLAFKNNFFFVSVSPPRRQGQFDQENNKIKSPHTSFPKISRDLQFTFDYWWLTNPFSLFLYKSHKFTLR